MASMNPYGSGDDAYAGLMTDEAFRDLVFRAACRFERGAREALVARLRAYSLTEAAEQLDADGAESVRVLSGLRRALGINAAATEELTRLRVSKREQSLRFPEDDVGVGEVFEFSISPEKACLLHRVIVASADLQGAVIGAHDVRVHDLRVRYTTVFDMAPHHVPLHGEFFAFDYDLALFTPRPVPANEMIRLTLENKGRTSCHVRAIAMVSIT